MRLSLPRLLPLLLLFATTVYAEGPGTALHCVSLAALDTPFSCDLKDEITFEKAVLLIQKSANVPIFVVSVSVETPVKFRLPFQVTHRDALDYLTKQVGLVWVYEDEMIKITTPEKAKGQLIFANYYVGDLLGTPTNHPQDDQLHERFTAITDYIKTMVAPESWKDGYEDMMPYFPTRSLVVRQHKEEHAKIVELLNRLRTVNGQEEEVTKVLHKENEQIIIRQLETPVSFYIDKPMPLENVLLLLQGQVAIHIFMDHAALHELDVTSETLVNLQPIKEIPLRDALNLVLKPLGLTYLVEDEVLKITSITKAKNKYVTLNGDCTATIDENGK